MTTCGLLTVICATQAHHHACSPSPTGHACSRNPTCHACCPSPTGHRATAYGACGRHLAHPAPHCSQLGQVPPEPVALVVAHAARASVGLRLRRVRAQRVTPRVQCGPPLRALHQWLGQLRQLVSVKCILGVSWSWSPVRQSVIKFPTEAAMDTVCALALKAKLVRPNPSPTQTLLNTNLSNNV